MKKLMYGIVFLLVVALLVACGGQQPSEAEQPSGDTGEPAAPQEGEKITLRMWVHQNAAFVEGYEALIAAYMEENPNVEITIETFDYDLFIQTLQTAMPAGEEADIISLFGTWTSQYAERLAPAPDHIMTVAAAEDTFYAAPLGGFVVDGVLYGLPQEYNLEYGGVLVNKTKFEAAGVDFPPAWADRTDLLTDAKKLVEVDDAGVMTVSGFHFNSSDGNVFDFLAGIRQRGGDYWNADQTGFTFRTPEAKATLQWMMDAVEAGVTDPILFNDDENWVGDAFFEGRVAIGYIGTWAIADGRANYPDFADEWDYAWLPSHQGDPVFVADSGWGLVVSPNSSHKDIAWEFAKFATTNADNAMGFNIASGTIPALPDVAESGEIAAEMPWVAQALDILPYGSYLGNMPDRDLVIYDIVYPHLLNALQGLETIDEALEAMDNEANATFE